MEGRRLWRADQLAATEFCRKAQTNPAEWYKRPYPEAGRQVSDIGNREGVDSLGRGGALEVPEISSSISHAKLSRARYERWLKRLVEPRPLFQHVMLSLEL